MKLHTQVTQLNRVGKTLEKRLSHLGIVTVEDLLHYFPFRYEDYSQVSRISSLAEGVEVTVKAKIELISTKRSPRKRKLVTEAVVSDGDNQLRIVWFGQPFISKALKVGDEVYFSGKVKSDMFGMQMVSPAYEKVAPPQPSAAPPTRGSEHIASTVHTARIVPIYSLTAGITQKQIRFLVDQVIDMAKDIEEWLPEDILEKVDLMSLPEAIKVIHFPESLDELKHAEKRLKFDELFILQLRAEMMRQAIKSAQAPQITFQEKEIKAFVDGLPFELTKDQKISSWEILKDLEKENPMNRLLEGDVGSGKTVVAGMAALNTILNNFQVAIMAPTEVLAKQHYESFVKMLGNDFKIGILTGSEFAINNVQFSNKSKAANKREMFEFIKNGELDLVVGTHALISDGVAFKDLGLVIVDEQHRFGVEQRKKIQDKSGNKKTTPHFLSMTATPIPRSFALTIYGDLDLSIIKEMPKGRKQIQTRLVDERNRGKAYDFIRGQVKQGRQVFVICPLIEEKDNVEIKNVVSEKKTVLAEYEKLNTKIFPDLKIGYLHGKMKSKEKDEVMNNFASGKIDVLVSTSVVEVGVNIPNATVMMIEGSDRFGLAQLHQFRGRVGRSDHQSYCFLFTDSDSSRAKERLELFEKTNDGFKLAEHDLEMRGPGAVYGTAQSGMMQLKLATMQDYDVIKLAREVARGIDFEKYPELREKVSEWEKQVHLE